MFLSLIRVNASKCRLQGTCSTSPSTSTSPIEDYRFCQLTMQCIQLQCDFLENQVFLCKAISFSFFFKVSNFCVSILDTYLYLSTILSRLQLTSRYLSNFGGPNVFVHAVPLDVSTGEALNLVNKSTAFNVTPRGFLIISVLNIMCMLERFFLNILKILLVNRNRCFIDDG